MKHIPIALLLTLTCITANAADTVIKLKPIKEYPWDYGPQLIENFTNLLTTDESLKRNFAKFERIDSRSRYNGPHCQFLVLRSSSDADFQDSGGWETYKQTAVIYYSFPEGVHKGREMKDGVFAVFEISGKATYKGGDKFEPLAHEASARFVGFRKSIAVAKAPTDKE